MTPTQSRILVWVPAIFFVASLAFGAWVLSLPPRVNCIFDIMGRFPSPDGRQVALVVREGCGGATNAFVTSVAIKGPGGDFRYEDDRLFTVHSEIAMEIVWSGNSSLTIIYDRPYRIYRQLVVWGMMPISYHEKP